MVKGKYKIDTVHYRDEFGNLIFEESMIFSKLFAIGDEIIQDKIAYKVTRVAVVDNIQHVNMIL